eukprot:351965-Chlamydomonas_euryale.AAC.20
MAFMQQLSPQRLAWWHPVGMASWLCAWYLSNPCMVTPCPHASVTGVGMDRASSTPACPHAPLRQLGRCSGGVAAVPLCSGLPTVSAQAGKRARPAPVRSTCLIRLPRGGSVVVRASSSGGGKRITPEQFTDSAWQVREHAGCSAVVDGVAGTATDMRLDAEIGSA